MRKRLAALSSDTESGGHPLLIRHPWVTHDGLKHVWGLTAAGYREAEQLLDEDVVPPPQAFELETMKHHVALTEFFVGLLASPLAAALARVPVRLPPAARKRAIGGLFARAVHRGWRWTVVGDGVHLPWKAHEKGREREKVLRPDAVIELLECRNRVFVECEMGTHTIVPRHDDNKPNATTAKLERWASYVQRLGDFQQRRTWYELRYPDGFVPVVLFLVHSERRRQHVQEAVDVWKRTQHGQERRVSVRVLTLPLAVDGFLSILGQQAAPPPKPPRVVTSKEVRLIDGFWRSAITKLKAARADARMRGAEVPSYPAEADGIQALMQKWTPVS